MSTVKRYDFGTLGKVEKTPQGGIRVPAALTRTGVFIYRQPDGSERRELRLPEEVFSLSSLESLKHAPVTDLHPSEMVTSANWRSLAIGHVSEDVRQDGSHVAASLVVQDSGAIAKIDAGDRREISCGYDCEVEHVEGEHDGEKYDAIQRRIVYNHVAIGPEGWARGGSTCALRLDSKDAVQVTERESMKTIRIDGVDYVVGSPEHIAKLDGDNAKLRSERDTAQGRADAAEAKIATANKEIEALKDPKRFDGAVKERADLLTSAQRVLGKRFDASGKSDQEIKLAVIAKLDKSFKADGKSADYIDGAFRVLVGRKDSEEGTDEEEEKEDEEEETDDEPSEGKTDSIHDIRRPRHTHKNDATEAADVAKAQEKMRKDSASAWEQPLAISRDTR